MSAAKLEFPVLSPLARLRSPSGWLLVCLLGKLLLPQAAQAAEIGLAVEPAAAIPLTSPQSDRFGVGGGESIKLLVGVTPWLDIGAAASFYLLPASDPADESGIVWGFGGGVRIKRPHDAERAGISPWLDADALYIRTGALNRPGIDAAFGLAVPLGERRTVWVGPFVRYLQVIQTPDRVGFDNRDARTLALGLSLEVGPGIKQEPAPVAAPVVISEPTPCPACPVVVPVCPDRDKDGMPDIVDRCPDVVGLVQDFGCPAFKNIVVHQDRIELLQKIYFAYDLSTIEAVSYPVLDEVVTAMKADSARTLEIQGHTDGSGSDAYNLSLSDRRAEAVLNYLVAHGVPKERMTSKGFGEAQPLESNATVAGRETNRRVEFLLKTQTLTPGGAQ